MRLGTKADLFQCLEDLVPHNDSVCSQREVHMFTIDGAALLTSSSLLSLKRSMHPCSWNTPGDRLSVLFVVLLSFSMCTNLTASRSPDGEKEGTGQGDELTIERSYLQTGQRSCESDCRNISWQDGDHTWRRGAALRGNKRRVAITV